MPLIRNPKDLFIAVALIDLPPFVSRFPLHLATLPFGRVLAQGAFAFQMQQKSKYLVSCKTDPFELRSSLGFSKVDEAPCSRQFTD